MAKELSEEEVMENDLDPMDAINQIRRSEGVAEEDLATDYVPSDPVLDNDPAIGETAEDDSDLDAFQEEEEPAPETVDDEEDPAPKADVDEPKGEVDGESDDQDDTEEEASAEEEQAPQLKTFKANGKEFSFSQEEINEQFETVFGQAMDYTRKMQKIAPYRKMISALEQEGISQTQLNTAIDALKGNPDALRKILADNQIDGYELTSGDEPPSPYMPTPYGKNETQLEIEEVVSKIEGDQEYRITVDVIDEQWDSGSRELISSNPSMIIGLHNDIKSGLYDKVAPAAMKMKVLDGNKKSDVEYYMLAGEQITLQQQALQQQQQQAVQQQVEELNSNTQNAERDYDKASSEAQRKRKATSTSGRADRKGVVDYLDDNDEDFDAWYSNLNASI